MVRHHRRARARGPGDRRPRSRGCRGALSTVVHQLIDNVTGYPGLWLLCACSGVLVPVPEDVVLLYAGTRIAEGRWSWAVTLLVAWAGVATRDVVSWAFGRFVVGWLLGSE